MQWLSIYPLCPDEQSPSEFVRILHPWGSCYAYSAEKKPQNRHCKRPWISLNFHIVGPIFKLTLKVISFMRIVRKPSCSVGHCLFYSGVGAVTYMLRQYRAIETCQTDCLCWVRVGQLCFITMNTGQVIFMISNALKVKQGPNCN